MHISAGFSNSAYQFGAKDGQLKKRSSSKQMISISEKKTRENQEPPIAAGNKEKRHNTVLVYSCPIFCLQRLCNRTGPKTTPGLVRAYSIPIHVFQAKREKPQLARWCQNYLPKTKFKIHPFGVTFHAAALKQGLHESYDAKTMHQIPPCINSINLFPSKKSNPKT